MHVTLKCLTPARYRRVSRLLWPVLLAMAGCASHRAYNSAFSSETALTDNSHTYAATAGEVFNAVKISLIQQGFEIDEVNTSQGLMKGLRTFDDPKNKKFAYLITVTIDVTGIAPRSTILTAAASQKTVLNREVHKYYHFLGLLPIPTGREYQSVVRSEGNITGASFYRDLFGAVSRNLAAEHTATEKPATAALQSASQGPAHE